MTSLNTPVHAAHVRRPVYSQTIPCQPSTAETGRKLVQRVLGAWSLDELADGAVLIVTELIANASKHTSCQGIRLTVGRPSASRVRVGLVDWEPERLPAPGHANHGDESGRGLLLIDAVSDRWGYDLYGSDRCPCGKEVWAELQLTADGSTTRWPHPSMNPRNKEVLTMTRNTVIPSLTQVRPQASEASDGFDLDVSLVEIADPAGLVNLTDDNCGTTCGACTTNVA